MEDDLNLLQKMEDALIFFVNGRQPSCFGKWNTTSIFRKCKMTSMFLPMEDDFKKFGKGKIKKKSHNCPS